MNKTQGGSGGGDQVTVTEAVPPPAPRSQDPLGAILCTLVTLDSGLSLLSLPLQSQDISDVHRGTKGCWAVLAVDPVLRASCQCWGLEGEASPMAAELLGAPHPRKQLDPESAEEAAGRLLVQVPDW